MKEEIDNSTMIAGDFNMTFSITDRKMKQNINRETDLNIISQLDLKTSTDHNTHFSQVHMEHFATLTISYTIKQV